MIKTASVLAGHIFAAYRSAMEQAAYLRRHGYLQDVTVARVAEWVAAEAVSNRPGAQPAGVSATALPGLGRLVQKH